MFPKCKACNARDWVFKAKIPGFTQGEPLYIYQCRRCKEIAIVTTELVEVDDPLLSIPGVSEAKKTEQKPIQLAGVDYKVVNEVKGEKRPVKRKP